MVLANQVHSEGFLSELGESEVVERGLGDEWHLEEDSRPVILYLPRSLANPGE
jgi:hypothetical protein